MSKVQKVYKFINIYSFKIFPHLISSKVLKIRFHSKFQPISQTFPVQKFHFLYNMLFVSVTIDSYSSSMIVVGHKEAAVVNACRRFTTRDFWSSPLWHGTTVPPWSCICLLREWLLPLPINVPIILLTENFLCLTGRARESISSFSKALYRFGEFSAADTSQNPIECAAAIEAPSFSVTCKKQRLLVINFSIKTQYNNEKPKNLR